VVLSAGGCLANKQERKIVALQFCAFWSRQQRMAPLCMIYSSVNAAIVDARLTSVRPFTLVSTHMNRLCAPVSTYCSIRSSRYPLLTSLSSGACLVIIIIMLPIKP
jgi:hypothetical protein